jgi:hypothetical protein
MSEYEIMTNARRDAQRARRNRTDFIQMFRKIQEAAHDGQNGSATYALDRLALIQAIATTAIHRLED